MLNNRLHYHSNWFHVLSVAALLSALPLFGACAPRLYDTDGRTHYRSVATCSQGPLEFTLKATGHRWGETVDLWAISKKDIQGFYEVLVDGKVVKRGRWGQRKDIERKVTSKDSQGRVTTRWTWAGATDVHTADNVRCLNITPPRTSAGAPPPPDGAAPPPPRTGTSVPPPAPGVKATDARTPGAKGGLVRVDPSQMLKTMGDTVFNFRVTPLIGHRTSKGSCYERHLGSRSAFKRGATIRIRIWSTQPNDFEQTFFRLYHRHKVGGKPYLTYQKKQFKKCLDKHPDQRKRWVELKRLEDEKRRLATARKRANNVSHCTHRIPGILTDALGHPVALSFVKPCYCLRLKKDVRCWGAGGYAGFEARLKTKHPAGQSCYVRHRSSRYGFSTSVGITRPCRCFANPADPKCWGEGGYRAYVKKRIDGAWNMKCSVWYPILRPRQPRMYYRARKACRCFGNKKDVGCWGAGGLRGFRSRLTRIPEEGRCRAWLRTPHPIQKGRVLQYSITKNCGCFRNHRDTTCWGAGGHQAYVKQQADRIAASLRKQHPRDGRSRWKVEQAERVRKAAELARRRAELDRKYRDTSRRHEDLRRRETARRPRIAPSDPGPALPDKPPPARAEFKPGSPSKNATWVPGYWRRYQSQWHWMKGWWRVPEKDVKRGLTTKVKRAPPPARKAVRRPPKPSLTATWAPGYWHWHGGRYVWMQGRWRIPPSQRHRWRKSRWRRIRGGVLFLPGGWVIRP